MHVFFNMNYLLFSTIKICYTLCMANSDKNRSSSKKNVILSFRFANIPSIETFNGTLRYLKFNAKWNTRLFTMPKVLSPKAVVSAADEGIDGILMDHPLDETLSDALSTSQIPLVSIGNSNDRLFRRKANIAFLEVDNFEIGRMGARYLLSLGRYRTYGFVPDQNPTRWSRHRLRGFKSCLLESGHSANVFNTQSADDSRRYHDSLEQWLVELKKPAAVMLVGDYRAGDVFDACVRAHLKVPTDIAILGVDNNPILCDSLTPSLSSIEPAFEQEGFIAAKTLDRLMKMRGTHTSPEIIRIPPLRIVERESTAPAVSGSQLVDRAIDFIKDNIATPFSAKDVAKRLGVSQSLLLLRFRQHEKTTVQAAIVSHRLKAVCEKLKNTRMPISRIATLCGFVSANRLTHVFTAQYGMSPRDYRKSAALPSARDIPLRAQKGSAY